MAPRVPRQSPPARLEDSIHPVPLCPRRGVASRRAPGGSTGASRMCLVHEDAARLKPLPSSRPSRALWHPMVSLPPGMRLESKRGAGTGKASRAAPWPPPARGMTQAALAHPTGPGVSETGRRGTSREGAGKYPRQAPRQRPAGPGGSRHAGAGHEPRFSPATLIHHYLGTFQILAKSKVGRGVVSMLSLFPCHPFCCLCVINRVIKNRMS